MRCLAFFAVKDPDSSNPNQLKAESNIEATREFPDVLSAAEFYKEACNRLLDVNNWHKLAGTGTAVFRLTDERGQPVARPARIGDHFQIDIPGPGTTTGEGYDWVKVEQMDSLDNAEGASLMMTVRPATNPLNDEKDVAHFFTDAATSNFMVSREGNTVKVAVYGRNEEPNTEAQHLLDKARNIAVATGAIAGASEMQWNSLVQGILG